MRTEADLVRIRVARPYDAAALLELKRQLDRETAFMMYEPGERDSPVQDLAAELASVARSANSVVLLAELEDQLIGYVQLTGGSLRRSRATAYLVIGVLAHAAGRGIGTELVRQAQAWAAARGLHRLELTVMAHNTRAIRLYERTGFIVEGRRSECLLVDGQFIDELTMAALLPVPSAAPLLLTPPAWARYAPGITSSRRNITWTWLSPLGASGAVSGVPAVTRGSSVTDVSGPCPPATGAM
jgi:RimJ/RimL family protein N-acetyltransferase